MNVSSSCIEMFPASSELGGQSLNSVVVVVIVVVVVVSYHSGGGEDARGRVRARHHGDLQVLVSEAERHRSAASLTDSRGSLNAAQAPPPAPCSSQSDAPGN